MKTRVNARAIDFAKQEQFIYVSSEKHIIIVRNGTKYDIPPHQWLELFNKFASQY